MQGGGQRGGGQSPEVGAFVVFICSIVGVLALFGLFGIANVEVTEYALNYSRLTREVEKQAYLPGRYWISPLNYFIRFPSTVTTIAFANFQMDSDLATRPERELRSRTKDGLDVNIELSFQYSLMQDKLYELFTTFGGYPYYHNIFVRLAIDRLTESATIWTATEFFTERTKIGKTMEAQLLQDYEARLFSTIFSFQLRTVNLPAEFEESIQLTEVKRQEIRVAEAEQNSTRVQLETELMQAQRRTKVRDSQATGLSQSVLLENRADIAQFTATQEKSAQSYAAILQQLDNNQEELLEYMAVRALRDHPSAKTMIGLNLHHTPAAAA